MSENISEQVDHKDVMFQAARDVMNLGNSGDNHSVDLNTYRELQEAEYSKQDGKVELSAWGRDYSGDTAEERLPGMSLRIKDGVGNSVSYDVNAGYSSGETFNEDPERVNVRRVERFQDGTEKVTHRNASPRVYRAIGRLARIADKKL